MPDRAEVLAFQQRQQTKGPRSSLTPDQARAYLDRLDRIAGQLTELTGSDGWNLHMAHLTGNKDLRAQELEPLRDRVVRGSEFGDALAAMKLRAAYLQGGIDALEEAMSDAKQIIEVNRGAREFLDKPATSGVMGEIA